MLIGLVLSLNLFWQLLKADICIYRQVLFDEIVDNLFWMVSSIVVFGYIFPQMGLSGKFGLFFAIGGIVGASFWSCFSIALNFLSDIEGNRAIGYFLILPISNSFLIIKSVLSNAIKTIIPSFLLFPVAKIFFWNEMSLANFSVFKFSLVFILANLFCGAFSLIVASYVKSLQHVNQIFIRILFPMWFFGGANFPWKVLFKFSPLFAYISFLNPLFYAFEGVRGAIEGSENYLSFEICVAALIFFTMLFIVAAYFRLKKRLDFI